MRTREEIGDTLIKINKPEGYEVKKILNMDVLLLEVLLDIRDLLTETNEREKKHEVHFSPFY